MAIQESDRQNFETILNAAKNGDLALLECADASSGEKRSVVCAINRDGTDFVFVPLAKLFVGNPYDELTPPE
jgi:Family of unknown function (DUF6117)